METLVTVTIVGIGFVVVLGALWTSLRVSDFHRKTTTASTILRNYAEALKQNSGGEQYIPCATLSGATAYPVYTPPAPYSTFTAVTTKIEYLTGYSGSDQPTWQDSTAGCPAGGDKGLQRLTLRVQSPTTQSAIRATENLVIIKRDARGEA